MERYQHLDQLKGTRFTATLIGPPVSTLRGVLYNNEDHGVWLRVDNEDDLFFIPYTAIQTLRFAQ